MLLTFPMRDMTIGPGEKATAFRYDEPAGIYRLVLPDRQDDEELTISCVLVEGGAKTATSKVFETFRISVDRNLL